MAGFPSIIRSLPEADHPFRDIALWLLRGPTACAIFVEAHTDSEVPEHSHGPQWGVIVSGDLDCLQLVSESVEALVPRRGRGRT